jgi:hypothetical protein
MILKFNTNYRPQALFSDKRDSIGLVKFKGVYYPIEDGSNEYWAASHGWKKLGKKKIKRLTINSIEDILKVFSEHENGISIVKEYYGGSIGIQTEKRFIGDLLNLKSFGIDYIEYYKQIRKLEADMKIVLRKKGATFTAHTNHVRRPNDFLIAYDFLPLNNMDNNNVLSYYPTHLDVFKIDTQLSGFLDFRDKDISLKDMLSQYFGESVSYRFERLLCIRTFIENKDDPVFK